MKKNYTIKYLFTALLLIGGLAASAQTNFYVRKDSLDPAKGTIVRVSVANLKCWTTNADGTKGTLPTSFTLPNQIFNIQANGYTSNVRWIVSGTGSKVVVGAQDSIISFTSAGLSKFIGTVDVLAGGTFYYQGAATDSLSFGNLAMGSTVRFGGNATASQKVVAASYYNLNLTATSTAAGANQSLPLTLPAETINVAGIFTPRVSNSFGATINFNGTGGQSIPGGTYYNLTISGSKSVPDTLKGTISIINTFTDGSTGASTLVGTGTVAYVGLAPHAISNRTFYNLTFANGRSYYVSAIDNASSTITLFAPEDLAVGDKVNSNPLGNAVVLDTSTVITKITNDTILTLSTPPLIRLYVFRVGHALNVRDTVYATSFSTIDKSVTLTDASLSHVAIGDTLNGQIITSTNTVKALITGISGNVVTQSAAIVNPNYLSSVFFGSASGKPSDKTIAGTINMLNTFAPGTGVIHTSGSTFSYNGTKQNVAGITYDNLTINQGGASNAVLAANATVNGVFTLTQGKLTTTTAKLLTLDVNASFPTVANDTFFVSGPLAKNFASTTPFTYQIGAVKAGTGVARSVSISPNTADAKTYIASWTIGKVANNTKFDAATINAIDSGSYYTIALANYAASADTAAKYTFQYRYDTAITAEGLRLANYITNKFVVVGNTAVPAVGPTTSFGTITTDDFITTNGRFAFAFGPIITPVKFGTISASALANSTVKVSWQSLTEVNVSSYVVEASTDGVSFAPKGSIKAVGLTAYSFIDITPATGVNYYRIKAVDNDGKTTYSASVSVNESGVASKLAVYPNPVKNKQLNFVLGTVVAANYTLVVTNTLGQTVLAKTISHSGSNTSYSVSLPASTTTGTYFIKLGNGNNQLTKTIFVQ
ncbi:beta strand repeat-containing protein [Parasediminibacterium sp. JCM 36343]|uniref:beta strand repeat-containing protein n=1 Tax=Parasediminibacterium sp. JCM 36343 TaxID=3374279 RepID=UPI00397B1D3C